MCQRHAGRVTRARQPGARLLTATAPSSGVTMPRTTTDGAWSLDGMERGPVNGWSEGTWATVETVVVRVVVQGAPPASSDTLARAQTRMCRRLDLLCERAPRPHAVVAALAWLGDVLETVVVDRMNRAAHQPGPA